MAKGTLTAAAVERMKAPAEGQVDRFDQGYPGLALRVGTTGRKTWVFIYRLGGRKKRLTLGTYPALSLADARAAWRLARDVVAAGRDPAAEKTAARARRPDTVRAVAEQFLEKHASRNRTADDVARMFERHLYPELGDRDIATVTRRDILDLLDAAQERGAKVAVNRVLANVRTLFAWAVERDILEASPAAAVRKPAPETARDRVLTDAEIVAFWRACRAPAKGELAARREKNPEAPAPVGEPFGTIFRLLLLTGQRRDEVGAAPWAEFDLGGAAWELPGSRTKNGRPHVVPLPDPALALITGLRRRAGSSLLFPATYVRVLREGAGERSVSGYSKIKLRLDAAMLAELREADPKATLAPWRLHDLRRTAATGMARIGIQPHVVEAVLNHAGGFASGVAGVYNRHSYAAEKRAALDAWGRHVLDLVGERPATNVVALNAR